MATHTFMALSAGGALGFRGKCSCGEKYQGAQTMGGMEAQHQNHLREVGTIPGHDTHQKLDSHRQAWTQKQLDLVDSWMDTHRLGREIEDEEIRAEAARDLFDDLWDAKLLAGS